MIDESDRRAIVAAVDRVVADCHRVPGAVWDLGKTLAGHAVRAKMGAHS